MVYMAKTSSVDGTLEGDGSDVGHATVDLNQVSGSRTESPTPVCLKNQLHNMYSSGYSRWALPICELAPSPVRVLCFFLEPHLLPFAKRF
jgi:hypothetical protein